MQINEHPKYGKLIWIARWKIFNYTHARGFWWPWVPVLLASTLVIKAVSPTPMSDYLLWFCLIMYVGGLPLLVMLARRAQRQRVGDIGISVVDKHHVSEGLKMAKVDIEITDDMTYEDFIVCNLIAELARI